MLGGIAKFFEDYLGTSGRSGPEQSVDRLQLASAALMIELCKADSTIDHSETEILLNILQTRFGLDRVQLDELMTLAEQEASAATSLYQFTSLMNEQFDYADKVQLVRNLWDVAYADGRIDRYEEHMIRKVADLLYLSHVDFIRGKHLARDAAGGQTGD